MKMIICPECNKPLVKIEIDQACTGISKTLKFNKKSQDYDVVSDYADIEESTYSCGECWKELSDKFVEENDLWELW